jgi:hypothetical protein
MRKCLLNDIDPIEELIYQELDAYGSLDYVGIVIEQVKLTIK